MPYVDTFKCHVCNTAKEVVHSGKPTLRDFSNSELTPDGKKADNMTKKYICWNCEGERDSDE